MAVARLEEADDHVDGGALARAVRTEVADDLAAIDGEAHFVDGEQAGVSLDKQRTSGMSQQSHMLRYVTKIAIAAATAARLKQTGDGVPLRRHQAGDGDDRAERDGDNR